MCPSFKNELCELAGIEPERITCADKHFCTRGEWEKCKVFLSQFLISTGRASDGVGRAFV